LPAAELVPWLVVTALIAVGLLERFFGLGHRSLWLDEAWVANLVEAEHTLRAILYQKELHWSAVPLLFAVGNKLAISAFGTSETAFRLMPCLFGAGSIFIFVLLAREIFAESKIWMLPVGIFALHPRAIYYSKELKQFSGEVFFTILILYLFVLAIRNNFSSLKVLWALFFAALIALGFGIPVVFVIAGVSIVLIMRSRQQKNRTLLYGVVIAAIILGISEASMYFLWLRPQVDLAYSSFWSPGVFPPDGILASIRWLTNRGFSFFSYDFGFPTLVLGEILRLRGEYLLSYVACLLCGLGVICFFFEKRRDMIYVYLITILSMVTLSFLHKWPLGGSRVNLFLLPFHLVFLARGVEQLARVTVKLIPNTQWRWAVAAACVLPILPIQSLDENLWHLKEREEMRSIVEHVKSNLDPETQRVFVYYHAKEAFNHYWSLDGRHPGQELFRFASTSDGEPAAHAVEIIAYCESLPDSAEQVYLVFSHIRGTSKERILDLCRSEFGFELDSREVVGASAYLFEIRKEQPTA